MPELRELDGLQLMPLEQSLATLSDKDLTSFISSFTQALQNWYSSRRTVLSDDRRFRTPAYDVVVAFGRAQRQLAFGVILDEMRKRDIGLDWPDLVSDVNGESIFSAFPEVFAGDVDAAHAYTLGWVLRQTQGPYYDVMREGRL